MCTIFDIQRCSFVDGPGIRTTVFFKGCNLRCRWCHNPEGIDRDNKGLGQSVSVAELMKTIEEDIPFYGNDGGLTASGGECMLQYGFLKELLKACQMRGIHTAVDTAGNVPWNYFEEILEYTDLVLYDIKCITSEKHKAFTGVDNDLILENARKLYRAGTSLIVRIPLVPSFNDDEKEAIKIGYFLNEIGNPKTEVLPYHTMGNGKYRAIGKVAEVFDVPTKDDIDRFKKIIGVMRYEQT